jgi:hypothetical protein
MNAPAIGRALSLKRDVTIPSNDSLRMGAPAPK